MKVSATSIVLGSVLFALSVLGQQNEPDWKRVILGDGFTIDVDATSLELGPGRQIAARFRTNLGKAERINGQNDTKYKTRLETIRFDPKEGRYQYSQVSLLDTSGKPIFSSLDKSDWKPMIRTALSFYNAAKQLPPFGRWKIIAYHYVNGDKPGSNEPKELTQLVGDSVVFFHDEFRVGTAQCSVPTFDRKTLTKEDVIKQLGPPQKALGNDYEKFEVLQVSCQSEAKFPPSTQIFSLSNRKTLMVWEGVLLELESPSPSRWSFLKDIVIHP